MYTIKQLFVYILIFHALAIQAQQDSNPETFFGKAKSVKDMCTIRLNGIPDSIDLYTIFRPNFARKAVDYYRYYYCYTLPQLIKDTASLKWDSICLETTFVNEYHMYKQWSDRAIKLDSANYFLKNPNLKMFDITKGKGSYADYYARYWLYINNKWVVLEDIWHLLLYLDSAEVKAIQNFRSLVKCL
jgi:hypothetical protein